MKTVVLYIGNHPRRHELGWRASVAIDLSNWCKDHGLVPTVDYMWALHSDVDEVHFAFFDKAEAFGTFFALRWSEFT